MYVIYDIGPILHIKLISAAASLVTWDLAEFSQSLCWWCTMQLVLTSFEYFSSPFYRLYTKLLPIEMCYFGSDAAAFLSNIREMENKVLKPNELP